MKMTSKVEKDMLWKEILNSNYDSWWTLNAIEDKTKKS